MIFNCAGGGRGLRVWRGDAGAGSLPSGGNPTGFIFNEKGEVAFFKTAKYYNLRALRAKESLRASIYASDPKRK